MAASDGAAFAFEKGTSAEGGRDQRGRALARSDGRAHTPYSVQEQMEVPILGVRSEQILHQSARLLDPLAGTSRLVLLVRIACHLQLALRQLQAVAIAFRIQLKPSLEMA
jgi:hypothetical protein